MSIKQIEGQKLAQMFIIKGLSHKIRNHMFELLHLRIKQWIYPVMLSMYKKFFPINLFVTIALFITNQLTSNTSNDSDFQFFFILSPPFLNKIGQFSLCSL